MQIQNIIRKIDSGELTLEDFSYNGEIDLVGAELIGSGAVGSVYLIGDKVVKVVLPCEANKTSALHEYCEDIQKLENPIPHIPGGNGKIRYSLPNLLSEISIGMILGKMKESVGFTKTLSSEILDKREIYIEMEAQKEVSLKDMLNPELKMHADNPKTFLYFLFQICHALMTAQEKHKLTHYDLHIENILWNDWPADKKFLSYPLPKSDKRLVIPQAYCPFILKISDFALARLEIKRALVTPLLDNFPEKTYGEFNPSYDIISLIGTILIDNKYRVVFDEVFQNLDTYKFMLIFSLWVFNDKTKVGQTLSELDNLRDQIGNKYFTPIGNTENKFNFRPKKDGDFVQYKNTKSLVEIVEFLGKVLTTKTYALFSDVQNSKVLYLDRLSKHKLNKYKLSKYKEYDPILTYTPPIADPLVGGELYREMSIDAYLNLRTYKILLNEVPKDYNFTVEQKQLDECPLQEHFITIMRVQKDYGEKYNFGFDCCKLDPANYLSKKGNGLVINGGFFAIKDNFAPIGLYRDKTSTLNEYKIPEEYRDVFRYITLKDNKLTIQKRVKSKEQNQVLASGPILIENGKIAFDPYDLRFHCTDVNNAGDTLLSLTKDDITTSGYYKYKAEGNTCQKEFVPIVKTYPRCDKIDPGELSHTNNPNPRSALAILEDGDYLFITVEGRSERGIGMDLYSLAQYIQKHFPVKTMINLDGGRSSNMAWKHEDTIYVSNPKRDYAYPVGNILSLLEK